MDWKEENLSEKEIKENDEFCKDYLVDKNKSEIKNIEKQFKITSKAQEIVDTMIMEFLGYFYSTHA